MKILLGDVNAKVENEDTCKQTVGNESLNEVNNGNEVRVVNFAASKNLIVKSATFPHRDILNTWAYSDGVTRNQIDHVLIDKRRYSNILDV
jgi:hypothetical protein